MATYLVTGGAGFIGSHLVEELVKRKERVRVLDDLSTGKLDYLDSLRSSIEIIVGDIRDPHIVTEATRDVDFVMHQAALVPGAPSADPLLCYEVNVGGTLNILFASRDAGVRRVVYGSTYMVYGPTATVPQRESMGPEPVTAYAETKMYGEEACQDFTLSRGLETVCLRYFSVYGPRQLRGSYSKGILDLLESTHTMQRLIANGDADQKQDYTYISDVVEANLLSAQSRNVVPGRVFNIGTGCSLSLSDIGSILWENLDIAGSIEIEYREALPGNIRYAQADISRARTSLGYNPGVQPREGLAYMAAIFKSCYGTRTGFMGKRL